jgi:hypothetical protein
MGNNKMSIDELSEKVLQGVREAVYELIKTSAASNKELVISDKQGNIKTVPAKDLLNKIQK